MISNSFGRSMSAEVRERLDVAFSAPMLAGHAIHSWRCSGTQERPHIHVIANRLQEEEASAYCGPPPTGRFG